MPYRLLVGRDLDHLCVLSGGGAIGLASSLLDCDVLPGTCMCWSLQTLGGRGGCSPRCALGGTLLHALSLGLESQMGCGGKAGCRDNDCILGFSFP